MYSLILHGKKLVDLRKWHNLRVSVKLLQNASSFSNSFSSANASSAADVNPRDGRKGQNFTVSAYLVESLGLTRKLAESISRKVSSEDKVNPDSVLSLFRSHGFTDSQISSIITDYPKLLMLDAEKSIGPKLQFLQSRGASTSELTEVISTVPKILGKTGDNTVSRYYDFVKEIVKADESSKYEKLCLSLPQGSKQENKHRNVLVLRELGVPQRFLFSLLISNGKPVCGKVRFEESLKKVVEMGFDPTTSLFVQALKAVYVTSDKGREEKVELYKRLGFDVKDVWEMFKKWPSLLAFSEKKIVNSFETFLGLGFTRDEFVTMVKILPPCIGLSTETVKKKIEFVVKQMNWPLKTVVSSPHVLGYSMEKRMVPRCNVLRALLSKGLLRNGVSELPPMPSLLAISHQAFLDKYVMKHDDKELVAELMAIFTGDRAS